ncbi:putative membrane protein SpoIIM required for sporulation [Alkalibacillus flavidus]|uniref:Membrane protein SpoIIM required for sporulation n=1 Tax=Alkalibacillus flavidus TaxID=546021 RepID=A0ABV2KSK2_9BACI
MGKHYRYRLPPWMRKCIMTIERCIVPIMIFQLIRTLLFPTTLDVFLAGAIVGIFIGFYMEWF